MRKLDLLAGNCSFLYENVTGHHLKCLILRSFFRFLDPPQTEQTSGGFRQFYFFFAIITDKEESVVILSEKMNFYIFVFTFSKVVPLKTGKKKENVYSVCLSPIPLFLLILLI